MADLAELTHEFDLKISAQTDPEKARDLDMEKQKAISSFLADELKTTKQTNWKQTALKEFPSATPSELVGDDEDAIKSAAKVSHERFEARMKEELDKRTKEIESKLAEQAWGKQGTGGATPKPPGGTQSEEAEIDSIWASMRKEASPGGMRQGEITPHQYERLVKLRMGHLFDDRIEKMKLGR